MACNKFNSHGTLRRLLPDNLKRCGAKFREIIFPYLNGDEEILLKSVNEIRTQCLQLFDECTQNNETAMNYERRTNIAQMLEQGNESAQELKHDNESEEEEPGNKSASQELEEGNETVEKLKQDIERGKESESEPSNEAGIESRIRTTSNHAAAIQRQESMKMIFAELIVLFVKDFMEETKQKPAITVSEYLQQEKHKIARKWKPVKEMLSGAQIITEDEQLFEFGVWHAVDDERLKGIKKLDIAALAQALFVPLECKNLPDKYLKEYNFVCTQEKKCRSYCYINVLPVLQFESQVAYEISFKINDETEVELVVYIFARKSYEITSQSSCDSQQIHRSPTPISNDDKVVIRVCVGDTASSQYLSTENMAITAKIMNETGLLADEGSFCITTTQADHGDYYDIAFPKEVLNLCKDARGYININIRLQPRHQQVKDEDKDIVLMLF